MTAMINDVFKKQHAGISHRRRKTAYVLKEKHEKTNSFYKKKTGVLERMFSSWTDLMSIGYQS